MFQGLVGVLALGVLAVMVGDFTKSGSQGPAVLTSAGGDLTDFYKGIQNG